MAARFGNVLYWLGTIIAVLAIFGAIIWNGVTYYEGQQTLKDSERYQENLTRESGGEKQQPSLGSEDWIDRFLDTGELPPRLEREARRLFDSGEQPPQDNSTDAMLLRGRVKALQNTEDVEHKRLTNLDKKQETSLILGGVIALIGLFAYGTGWAARYILRGRAE